MFIKINGNLMSTYVIQDVDGKAVIKSFDKK